MVAEANIVRRPRHFRIRLTEDIGGDGLSMRSPVELVGSRRRLHGTPREAPAGILSVRLVGTRAGATSLIDSAILLGRGFSPDNVSSFGPTALTPGRGVLSTRPRRLLPPTAVRRRALPPRAGAIGDGSAEPGIKGCL